MYTLFYLFLVIVFCSQTSHSQERKFAYLPYQQIVKQYSTCFDSTNIWSCERAAVQLSFIGLHEEAMAAYNICHPAVYQSPKEQGRKTKDYKFINARKYLLSLTGHQSVVMINEEHSRPQHRLFTTTLLKKLKEQGFTHLALEGLNNSALLKEITYPTKRMGYYIAEPQYANMIRKALKLGFVVVGYDVSGVGVKEREYKQAQNIAKILKEHSNARILVHAGGGHIREDTLYYGGLMAYQFKQLTGIDPLTINQTRMNEQSAVVFEHPFYRQLKQVKMASFMLHRQTNELYNDGITDLILFHPRTTYRNGRPSWMYQSKQYYKQTFKLDTSLVFPILILVFPFNEKDVLTVPCDAVELRTVRKKVALFMPEKGKYSIAILDSNGNKSVKTIEAK